ncbi:MAG: hypothetical protein N3B21_19510 [Clostridia bacterium]|nr:hypothetical protein [Clostridia bacterium]
MYEMTDEQREQLKHIATIAHIDEERLMAALGAAQEVFEKLKEMAKAIGNAIMKACKTMWEWLKENWRPLIKRLILSDKRLRRKYYESLSVGRSNNWRKMHGLHLARNSC